jgi:hypothetical protein
MTLKREFARKVGSLWQFLAVELDCPALLLAQIASESFLIAGSQKTQPSCH